MNNRIITIGRQLGTNDLEIVKILSKKLDIPFYDKGMLKAYAENSDLKEKEMDYKDKMDILSTGYSGIGSSFGLYNFYPINYLDLSEFNIYKEQSKSIKDIASKESCIFLGRCADTILKNLNIVRIFLYSDIEKRISHISENDQISQKEAKKLVKSVDKRRAQYYTHYSGEKWGATENYDLCINTSSFSSEQIADAIIKLY